MKYERTQKRGWQVGKRVCRKDDETRVGTIAKADVHVIKVQWDAGGTSDYSRHKLRPIPLSEYTDKAVLPLLNQSS
jgi:hypothetical protein